MSAKDKLAMALQQAKAPDWMVQKAKEGFYADFESPIATPIMQLVADCRDNGLPELSIMAMNGEFDGR